MDAFRCCNSPLTTHGSQKEYSPFNLSLCLLRDKSEQPRNIGRNVHCFKWAEAIVYDFYSECISKQIVMGSLVMSHRVTGGGREIFVLLPCISQIFLMHRQALQDILQTFDIWDSCAPALYLIDICDALTCAARCPPNIWYLTKQKYEIVQILAMQYSALSLSDILHCPAFHKVVWYTAVTFSDHLAALLNRCDIEINMVQYIMLQ